MYYVNGITDIGLHEVWDRADRDAFYELLRERKKEEKEENTGKKE